MAIKNEKNVNLEEEVGVESTKIVVEESVWTKIGRIFKNSIKYIIVGGVSLGTGILIGAKFGGKTECYDDSNDVQEIDDSNVEEIQE